MTRAVILLVLACLCEAEAFAGEVSDAPKGNEEQRVLEYLQRHPQFLLEHPDLLLQAIALRQKVQHEAVRERRRSLIQDREASLFASEFTSVRGNVAARYTLIEFSDYQCIPCRSSYPAVEAFIRERSDIRAIHLQLPVYGPQSIMAARAALIAQRLGKFERFHTAIMQTRKPVDLHTIEAALAVAGVSRDDLRKEMTGPKLSDYLKEVKDFAVALNVVGTPPFLLNGELINGAVDEKVLNDAFTRLAREGEQ
jgi:protein-disulfide isomerase